MNRDEAKKMAEEQAEMLRENFWFVKIIEDTRLYFFYCEVSHPQSEAMSSIKKFYYKEYPPKGEVCEVWDDDEHYKEIAVHHGNGMFSFRCWSDKIHIPYKKDNWRSLGVNINDK